MLPFQKEHKNMLKQQQLLMKLQDYFNNQQLDLLYRLNSQKAICRKFNRIQENIYMKHSLRHSFNQLLVNLLILDQLEMLLKNQDILKIILIIPQFKKKHLRINYKKITMKKLLDLNKIIQIQLQLLILPNKAQKLLIILSLNKKNSKLQEKLIMLDLKKI